ncbi:hypothetical protein EMPG_16799 [Blastomyces silverae]|uniref:Uncharacterized protein n=1 Tax=Blastomyces silverae TaxID=2060906 RepID=A0A0H1B8J1_9EURO|nr:hypothetical protein EMPG_16799 [Blastomyces silverae]
MVLLGWETWGITLAASYSLQIVHGKGDNLGVKWRAAGYRDSATKVSGKYSPLETVQRILETCFARIRLMTSYGRLSNRRYPDYAVSSDPGSKMADMVLVSRWFARWLVDVQSLMVTSAQEEFKF